MKTSSECPSSSGWNDTSTGGTARFVNRELSWLEFNQRVLDEAKDPGVPLLERLKFLAITGSNLDEFFMVRVGGLQMLAEDGRRKRDPAGLTPAEQLEAISDRAHRMVEDQVACHRTIEDALAQAGIRRIRPEDASAEQAAFVERRLDGELGAILTPMAVDEETDFPLLVGQPLSMLVTLAGRPDRDAHRFAVIPFGPSTGRFVPLPSTGGYDFMLLEDAVAMFAGRFFPGEEVIDCAPFRVTRNADLTLREDMAYDLMSEMEQVLDARKESACVRLELSATMHDAGRAFLQRRLHVDQQDLYAMAGPLTLAAFMALAGVPGFDELRSEQWPPRWPAGIDERESIFEVLARQDVLLCHPFDSFDPVIRLLEQAAEDPDVLAIKQVLYRTSRRSPIVAALARAAESGKYVTAVVELKARFDEARNIEWARDLERAGVQVIYGVKRYKIHAKACVIVRREAQGIRRYVHYGTGNYNEVTARLYTDVSLLTSDEDLGADATTFFNTVNGYSQVQAYRKIDMAPVGLRDRLLELIDAEAQRLQRGQPARIMAKLNSLADPRLIEALYAASQAGVTIELNVRGICCLRPGVPGLSENISVVSIVDRFLEHSRLFYFRHGGDEQVLISSADWMPRNLDKRLELLVPVEDPAARARLVGVLRACLADGVKGRKLLPDGGYLPPSPAESGAGVGSQETLYRATKSGTKQPGPGARLVLEPHRAPGEER